MNRKGQLGMLGIMFAVMFLIVTIVLIEPVQDQVTIARDASHLNCADTTISTGDRMGCIVVDWYLPIFVWTGIAVGLGFTGMRRLRDQGA